jgi:F-type H+-transporting ATPase subunit b
MGAANMTSVLALAEFSGLVTVDPNTIILTLINTGIIMLLFRIFLYKPVSKMLDKRREATIGEIEAARLAKEKAEAAEKEYTQRLAQSKLEAQEIIMAAQRRAQQREDEIIAGAQKSAELLRAKAEETIEREKKSAVNEIKNQISDLVVLAASAVAEKEITAADNQKLIDSFILNL